MSGRPPGSARGRGGGRGGGRGDGSVRGRGGARGGNRGDGSVRRGRGQASYDLPSRPTGGFMSEGSYRGGGHRGGRSGFNGAGEEAKIYAQDPGASEQLNPEVERIENATAQIIHAKQLFGKGMSTDNNEHPLRPGYGTRGKPVLLWANYFEMSTKNNLELFRYSISVAKDEKERGPVGKKLKQIVNILIQDHFPGHASGIATDGKANLISNKKLRIDQEIYPVHYRSEDEARAPVNTKVYQVKIEDTGSLTVSELINYLTSTSAGDKLVSKEEIIQALNIVVGYYPKTASSIFSVGANKHFQISPPATEWKDLDGFVHCIRGLFSSVRTATSRLLVNVQVKHVTVYPSMRLDELMWKYWQWLHAQNVDSNQKVRGRSRFDNEDTEWPKVSKYLKGFQVKTSHLKDTNGKPITRIKTIFGLATKIDGGGLPRPPRVPTFAAGPVQIQFWKSNTNSKARSQADNDGSYVSISDYFKSEYQMKTNPDYPVVNVGSRKDPSYLPVEACHMIPCQPYNSELFTKQRDNMVNFAARAPYWNAESIIRNANHILGFDNPSNTTLKNFQIGVKAKLLAVPGRILNSPRVLYANKGSADTRAGSWNMRDIKFSQGTTCDFWSYINIVKSRGFDKLPLLKETLEKFQNSLKKVDVIAKRRLDGNNTIFMEDIGNDNSKLTNEVTRIIKNLVAAPRILLIVLPDKGKPLYKQIKLIFDVKLGIRNVCVVSENFLYKTEQYYANVALKFNLKLGGRNQVIEQNQMGIIGQGKTMVVGIDVTHPSPGSALNAPSVAGIVASIDAHLAQWPACLYTQTGRTEMVFSLGDMLKSRLQLWRKHNKQMLPDNILIYRDGVSEGQYNIVLKEELSLLRKACQEIYPTTATKQGFPKMSIIVVGKRHNTRFYPTSSDGMDPKSFNPANGTVVDRGVTEARNWDFFLQAHAAIKGTARPAHYYVILDEIFRRNWTPSPSPIGFASPADALEDLTHKMCYLFGRATKAVSICPAAYYADLVCERARCYVASLSDGTPAASVKDDDAASVAGSVKSDVVDIHENVRDTMFYL